MPLEYNHVRFPREEFDLEHRVYGLLKSSPEIPLEDNRVRFPREELKVEHRE